MHWFQQVLWVAGLGLAAALAVKLAVTGLIRMYAWFSAFLCFDILRSVILLPISQTTNLYGWIFLITQPLSWLLYILVVLELYQTALREYRGVTTLSRWTLLASLVIAVGIAALTLGVDLGRPVGIYPVLGYYSVIERGLCFSLAVFLLLITAFLAWFPLPVYRNVRLHAGVYTVFFLSTTLALFLRNVRGYATALAAVNLVLLSVGIVCYTLWLWGLNLRGEEQVATGRRWQPEDEERLLRQLGALDAAVLRQPEE